MARPRWSYLLVHHRFQGLALLISSQGGLQVPSFADTFAALRPAGHGQYVVHSSPGPKRRTKGLATRLVGIKTNEHCAQFYH